MSTLFCCWKSAWNKAFSPFYMWEVLVITIMLMLRTSQGAICWMQIAIVNGQQGHVRRPLCAILSGQSQNIIPRCSWHEPPSLMIFMAKRQRSLYRLFAMANSLSWTTHVKNLSRHKVLLYIWPAIMSYIGRISWPCRPPNMAICSWMIKIDLIV